MFTFKRFQYLPSEICNVSVTFHIILRYTTGFLLSTGHVCHLFFYCFFNLLSGLFELFVVFEDFRSFSMAR